MRLFVGGIPYSTTEAELQEMFAAEGNVASVSIVKDRYSDQPRGFGFVEMPNEAEAQQAIRTLNGKVVGGRTIAVNEAKAPGQRDDRGPRSSGGGGGGYSSGGGRRY